MFRRQHAVVLGLATLLVSVAAQGCSSDTQATPRVTFDSTISAGSHKTTDCLESGPWFKIGSFGNPGAGTDPATGKPVDPVAPVENGGTYSQGTATVTCSVTPEADGFHVAATANLDGATGGSFRIEGHMTAAGDQSNLDVSIASQGRTYSQKNCTASYTTALQTTAAGRVWATLLCTDATNEQLQRVCKIDGEFRFENCGQ
jgi:hypothetical protein